MRYILAGIVGALVAALVTFGVASADHYDDWPGSGFYDSDGHAICPTLTTVEQDQTHFNNLCVFLEQEGVENMLARARVDHNEAAIVTLDERITGNQAASLANLSLYNDLVERIDALEEHIHHTGQPIMPPTTTTTTTTTVAPSG